MYEGTIKAASLCQDFIKAVLRPCYGCIKGILWDYYVLRDWID
jgi:hypothetical protein